MDACIHEDIVCGKRNCILLSLFYKIKKNQEANTVGNAV